MESSGFIKGIPEAEVTFLGAVVFDRSTCTRTLSLLWGSVLGAFCTCAMTETAEQNKKPESNNFFTIMNIGLKLMKKINLDCFYKAKTVPTQVGTAIKSGERVSYPE